MPDKRDDLDARDSQRWYEDDERRPRRRRRDDDEFDERLDDDDEPRSNPFAVWALVLGIVSLCVGIFSGIPAIILGVLGTSRAKLVRGEGRGMSIAGIVLGSISLAMTAAWFLLLIPAIQQVRQAANTVATTNDVKQVGLGFLDYHGKNGGLPDVVHNPKKAKWKDGQGLSWRVALLPHIGEDSLYKSFDLNKSWDSPANSAYSNQIVMTYTNPDEVLAQTRYQVFVGTNTLFDPKKPRLNLFGPGNVTDGTSNTILFAESAAPVPWASPKDMAYTPNGQLPALGRPGEQFFLVCMADGSVHRVNRKVAPNILHMAIQRNDNGTLPANWFE